MSLRLSKKHGVNPMVEQCFWCLKDKGVVLFGKLPGDREAPHKGVVNKEPCDECKGYMAQGIILISAKPGDDDQNPYRTGGWCVVKEEAVRRMFGPGELVDAICKMRVSFVDDEAWDRLGLPRGEVTDGTA